MQQYRAINSVEFAIPGGAGAGTTPSVQGTYVKKEESQATARQGKVDEICQVNV